MLSQTLVPSITNKVNSQTLVLGQIYSLSNRKKFFARKGINLTRRSRCRNGEVATFLTTLQFSSITFTFLDLQSSELAMHDFHPGSHQSLVLMPGIICTFLIHCGSLQKMLTALFNLVWNTKKSKWTIFLSAKA